MKKKEIVENKGSEENRSMRGLIEKCGKRNYFSAGRENNEQNIIL